MKPVSPDEYLENVGSHVMREMVEFCNLYSQSDIMRLFRIMERLDSSEPARDTEAAMDRYIRIVFETHLLPLALPSGAAVLSATRELEYEDSEQALRYFFQYADACLETETGNRYMYHFLNNTDTRRDELELAKGYALVVTTSDLAGEVRVPEEFLYVIGGAVERGDSPHSVTVSVPHVAIDVLAWRENLAERMADTTSTRSPMDQREHVCASKIAQVMEDGGHICVLRVIAASASCTHRLKRELDNKRTQFCMRGTHNDTGFLIQMPEMADPYRHALQAVEHLFDAL